MKNLFRSTFLLFSSLLLFFTAGFAQAAIEVAIEAGPEPVQPSETANVRIVISNSGNSLSGDLVVKMVYPDHLNWIYDGTEIHGGVCPGTTCDNNEIVTWQLGVLPPGLSHPLALYPVVLNGTVDGSAIPFIVEVFENNIKVAETSRSVIVQDIVPYDIAVDEDINPIAPGEPLVYTITYSNRSAASATSTALSFPLPQGVTFVSATDGGVLNGNTVEWNLNTLPAHSGGEQKVTVNVGGNVVSGSLLEVDKAQISGLVNFQSHTSSALAATQVSNNTALVLAMELNPDPVQPNEVLTTALTVSNPTNGVLFGVTLSLRYPEHLNWVYDGAGIDGGVCAGTTCDKNEIVTWQLGAMAPGSSQTVTLPPVVINGTTIGSLITLNAHVREDNGTRASQSRTVIVQSGPAYDIAVDEDINPVAPGEPLVYTITYSNRSAASASNTALRFPLPQGVTFVSATDGGVLNGNTVEWNLNTLPAHSGGEQKVTVNVGSNIVSGSLLEVDKAQISGLVNFQSHTSSALAATQVSNNTALVLAMELNPDPVQPNEVLTTALTVSNPTNGVLFGVTLSLRYPEHLNWVYDGAGIDGGVCAGTTCDKNEIVTWQLGTMAPGSSQTVTLPPIVLNGTTIGNLITFNATAFEDNNTQVLTSETAFVGTNSVYHVGELRIDTDGDGVFDKDDNCTLASNALQTDTDEDGYGNACDADFNNDGFVNANDLSIFKANFFTADSETDLNADGFVNANDLAIFKGLFFKAPGPSAGL